MSTVDNSHCPCPTFLDPKGTSLLQNFINLVLIDNPLDGKYIQLVNYFLKNPGKTAKEIDKAQLAEFRDYDYNTIRRHIKHLLDDLKLIEIQKKELVQYMKSKYITYYRLSLNGIFYIILNNMDSSKEENLMLSFLDNYKDNILFNLFLYPFVKEQTLCSLTAGWDREIFSNVFLYLRDVCKELAKSIQSLRNMDFNVSDGYIVNQISVFPNNSNQPLPFPSYYGLQYFLNKALEWNWIYQAQILPKIKENVIEIIDPYNLKNNSRITIMGDEKKAVLRQNGKKICEFSVHVNDSVLSLGAKTDRKMIDSLELSVVDHCRTHLLVLLTKLREISPYNVTFDILYQDENLKKALEIMELKPMVKDNLL